MIELQNEAAIDRVMQLMAIPGKSCEEAQVSAWIQDTLKKSGVPATAITSDTAHRRSPAGGEVGNLIVKLKGTVKAPRRLLMAHMDTVPLAVGCKPVRKGDSIRPASRSTALGGDDRSGCAVLLTAISEILRQKLPHPPLTLLFAVQEEIGLRGSRFITASKLGKPELCFNWDGRDPAGLIIAAVGATNLTIGIEGIASHAGVHPENGVNAAVVASLAIADLQKNGWHGLVQQGRNKGTSNVGVVEGGAATNVVMPELKVEAEARSHQPAFRKRIVKEFRKAFEAAVKSTTNAAGKRSKLTFEEDTRYEAFSISEKSDCVTVAKEAVAAAGLTPETCICDGGLDANWMSAHGFPTVTMGCGQHDIHTVDESLDIPEFLDACRIATMLASA
ncbi:M20/M25/M40 family metallo-hydrolase [Fuerstiella marisgermanici]|uniref:Peptidase T n=1 Tax=Fuerstiella marisgermanici TaxID=1891926 RepID=A0A1P8WSB9_9PLAN|nr:M20/M25/M40 family metallo-hydrolase [Fuerstiella marisgermanici]APZ96967.1 Peptidase T [Fuerstiella marisgermanici]